MEGIFKFFLGTENHNLKKELKQLEQTVETKDQELDVLQKKTQGEISRKKVFFNINYVLVFSSITKLLFLF